MKLTSRRHSRYFSETVNGLFLVNVPLKAFISSLFGTLVYLTGNQPKILEFVAILLLVDLGMGLLTALKHKTLSSDFLVTVLYKAGLYLFVLIGSNQFIQMCPYFSFVGEVFKILIASAEIISIMENADLLGFKHAKKIINLINCEVEKKLSKF